MANDTPKMEKSGEGITKDKPEMKKSKTDTLADKFDSIQKAVDKIFKADKAIYTAYDEDFLGLIDKFRMAGVDFLEIDPVRKTAIAKHENYYEYPEIRYSIVQDDKGKVKFYKLLFTTDDKNKKAEEITQVDFEDNAISTYLKPNDLMSKEDAEEDREPEDAYEDSEGSKIKKDEKSLAQDDSEKKVIDQGSAESSPKIKTEGKLNEMALMGTKYKVRAQSFDRKTNKPISQPREEVINIANNKIFNRVRSIGDIEATYESFWNDLNQNSEHIVKVISITAVNEAKKAKEKISEHRGSHVYDYPEDDNETFKSTDGHGTFSSSRKGVTTKRDAIEILNSEGVKWVDIEVSNNLFLFYDRATKHVATYNVAKREIYYNVNH